MSKVRSMRWEVYMKDKGEFIKKEFLVEFPHTRGGGVICACVTDNAVW